MGRFLRRTASAVLGLALAASAIVGAELPAAAATTCSATFDSYQTIKKGSTGAQAAAVECLLDQAGLAVTADAKISAAEADQMAVFRKSVGLDGAKAIGRRGWSALLARGTTPTLAAGDTGADVLRLQLALRSGGFKKVPANSTFDTATVQALKAAQKSAKLPQSGTTTAQTWKLLQSGHLVVKAPKKAKKKTKKKSSKGTRALAYAKKQLGDKYRYGAAGPNAWDCSGLTMKAWKSAGVKLPHSARAQFKKGKKVSRSNLKKGDLVFFYSGISHVGIYAGHGKIIHASRPGHPVSYAKISSMPYKGARRLG